MNDPNLESLLGRWNDLRYGPAGESELETGRGLLQECVEWGRGVARPGARANLQWLAREIGDWIYRHANGGGYPDTVIRPPDRAEGGRFETAGQPRGSAAPVWTVPAPNQFFTNRGEVLAEIRDRFTARGERVVALHGLGGVGKTQVAIEYARANREAYRLAVWVSALSSHTIERAFSNLARQLGLDGAAAADPKRAVQAALQWLGERDDWLLVFDDVEDPEVARAYVPPSGRGHVLVTSRIRDLSVLNVVAPIELPEWAEAYAVEFLLRRTGLGTGDQAEAEAEDAGLLARALGHFPLALEQAAAYIHTTRCKIRDYLRSFAVRSLELLERSRPADHIGSIADTWLKCFEQVERDPAAADLFRFSCFLAAEEIPVWLLVQGAPYIGIEVRKAFENVDTDPLSLKEALEPLTRYSLVQEVSSGASARIRIHSLVQRIYRSKMTEEGRRDWANRVVTALGNSLPLSEFNTWHLWEEVLPHARVAARYVEEYDLESSEASLLLYRLASYLEDRVQYAEAEHYYLQALSLAADRKERAVILNDLGNLLYKLGRFADAEPMLRESLEIQESLDDPSAIAVVLETLAGVVLALGRAEEAKQRYQKALGLLADDDRSKDLSRATLLSNLARVYRVLRDPEEAHKLNERALEVRSHLLPPYHPDRAVSLNNMAGVLFEQKLFSLAKEKAEEALKIWKDVLGPGEPSIATAYNNLAGICRMLDEREDSLRYYDLALKECLDGIGKDHPMLATVLSNKAGLLRLQGHYGEARMLYDEALTIRERLLGPDHVDVAKTHYHLGLLLQESEEKPAEARAHYLLARAVLERNPASNLAKEVQAKLESLDDDPATSSQVVY